VGDQEIGNQEGAKTERQERLRSRRGRKAGETEKQARQRGRREGEPGEAERQQVETREAEW
jgi:hypothetical protein